MSVTREKERAAMAAAVRAADVVLLLHVSLYLIKWTSPVDVGDLPSHVKYCVSVLTLHMSNYQYTTGPRMEEPKSPTTC